MDYDAKIYCPSNSATQAGEKFHKEWVLEFESKFRREVNAFMGWISSRDTKSQLSLKFSSLEAAREYAEKQGIKYIVIYPNKHKFSPKSYADNFIKK